MKRIVGLSIISILLLSCGGGGSSSNDSNSSIEITKEEAILKKEMIYVANNKIKASCESHEYYNLLAKTYPNIKNILIKSDDNNKTCASFLRDDSNCKEFDDREESNYSCIIGSDIVKSSKDSDLWHEQWYTNDWYFSQWIGILTRQQQEASEQQSRYEEELYQEEIIEEELYQQDIINQEIYQQELQQDILNQEIYQQDIINQETYTYTYTYEDSY